MSGNGNGRAAGSGSKRPKSPYETEFGTEQLQPGRRRGPKEAMFPVQGDKNLEARARSRALAVIRYRHEEELRELYLEEYAYLEFLDMETSGGNGKGR